MLNLSLLICLGGIYAFILLQPFLQVEQALTRFPEIYYGHTGVFLLNNGIPFKPAYMVFENGSLAFYNLYTNKSYGPYLSYLDDQKPYDKLSGYKQIKLADPLFRGRSLYEVATRVKPPRYSAHPTIRRIYTERRRVWWERLVRQYREFTGYHVCYFNQTL